MSTLYLDCISGIAGDMTLAALIDLGADLGFIEKHLKTLPVDPFSIRVEQVIKQGISAKKLCLHFDHQHHHTHIHSHHHAHRHAADILDMIERSELPPCVKRRSRLIFEVIAEAEGKIHGISPDQVHFHEVGAMDSIIDIIGTCLALENLRIEKIYASAVPVGSGKVRMAHGLYPIPAPATAELLTGIPLAELNVNGELTTPTGAGILKALVNEFKPIGAFTIEKIGYGAGEKDFEHPNVLRALIVKDANEEVENDKQRETIIVLQTQVDDMTGEALGYAMEQLFQAGALDVFYTPIYMKKNRPGTLITVLAPEQLADRCEDTLLKETTTLGVRRTRWTRSVLKREIAKVETPYGAIGVKCAHLEGPAVRQTPEYEEVARIAREKGVPFQEVYESVIRFSKEQ
ncbi:MAG: nickel pincer cofactor biosynthesis protein LarC [Thermoactinomyces sp.]